MSKFKKSKEIFGERLRQERIKRELTQAQLAFKMGIEAAYIGIVERGKKNITVDNMDKIAQFFKLSLSEMLDKSKLEDGSKLRLKVGRKPKSEGGR